MDLAVILALAAALLGCAMVVPVVWQPRRTIAHWAFAAGMLVLAGETAFSGLTADAALPEEMVYWQNWRLLATSLLPGTWLLFSLSYARGNFREFLAKWRLPLAVAFLGPAGVAVLFSRKLITSLGQTASGTHWILRLSVPGLVLYFLFLLSMS